MSVTGFNRQRRKLAEEARVAKEAEERGETEQGNAEGSETEEKLASLEEKTFKTLRKKASEAGIKNYGHMRKAELLEALKAVM